ncbi:hypothetical protein ABIE44_000912 [Marmoricola sp. OAE513]
MTELAGDLGAGLVDRLGDPRQTRRRGVVDDDDLPVGPPLRRDREVRDGGQTDAAARGSKVVVDQLVGDQAVRGPALEGRRLDGPVAQLDGTEGGRSEDVPGG